MGPSTYITAHEVSGAKVLVKALNNGKPFHRSVVITKESSGIRTLEEIKGKSFAFGDVASTSSHIVPRAMLLAAGVDIKDLLYYNYLGYHEDVIKAVMGGDFDAGGVMETMALKYTDTGIRVLKTSEDIPEFNVAAAGSLNSKTMTDVKGALISLDAATAEGRAVLRAINENYTGFTEASDEDFGKIRQMMSLLGLLKP
jgi:phosphonate transport system substrate-binding protein